MERIERDIIHRYDIGIQPLREEKLDKRVYATEQKRILSRIDALQRDLRAVKRKQADSDEQWKRGFAFAVQGEVLRALYSASE